MADTTHTHVPDEGDALVLEWCRPGASHTVLAEQVFGDGMREFLTGIGWLGLDDGGEWVTTPAGIAALERRYAERGRG